MRSVVVTGGTTRLGLAIAERLRLDGWRVITTSHRADSGADIIADLSKPMGAASLYAQLIKLLVGNPPDALVNNAALFTGDESDMECVNLVSPKKLTMLMSGREVGRGSVVNILDCRVLGGGESTNVYERTKRDLLDYTTRSAAMFAETLNINAVAPGPVLAPTDVHEKAGDTPLGRPTPEDVAAAVSFLLSASSTSGCVVPVDGGQSLFSGY